MDLGVFRAGSNPRIPLSAGASAWRIAVRTWRSMHQRTPYTFELLRWYFGFLEPESLYPTRIAASL